MTRFPFAIRLTTAMALLLAILVADSVQACPTCKDSLSENNPELIQGYFWSIMFMMAMPFSILTGIGTYFYLLIRKNKKNISKDSMIDAPLDNIAEQSDSPEGI